MIPSNDDDLSIYNSTLRMRADLIPFFIPSPMPTEEEVNEWLKTVRPLRPKCPSGWRKCGRCGKVKPAKSNFCDKYNTCHACKRMLRGLLGGKKTRKEMKEIAGVD